MKSSTASSDGCREIEFTSFTKRNESKVSLSEVASAAISAVGRVVHNTTGWQGTGCMVSEQLFITNNHVILNPQKATEYVVEFNYELDMQKCPKPVTKFALAPHIFFMCSPEEELDFTIIAVGKRVSGKGRLSDFGYCPMKDLSASETPEQLAHIIGHPKGRFKQTAICNILKTAINDEVIQYYADVEVGSSGSPIFNSEWQFIALHHWGAPTRKTPALYIEKDPKDIREGIRISAIVRKINSVRQDLPAKERSLIEEALACISSIPNYSRRTK
jgi:endonuclease G